MEKQLKVSVIIPVYNVDKYLKKCLDSVCSQTLKDIEIICIDDGSTDDSLKILKEYASHDDRIIIISQNNQGPGVARNKGIERASGEYIMFCDGDDWLERLACEDAYLTIKRNKNDLVFFNMFVYDNKLAFGSIDNVRLKPFWGYTNNPNLRLKNIKRPFQSTSEIWYRIYRTKFLQDNNIKFATIGLGEETTFIAKCYLLANTVSILPKCLYNYRKNRANSASSATSDLSKFDLYIEEKDKALKMMTENQDYNWLLKSYLPYYVSSLFFFYNKFRRDKNISHVELYNKLRRKIMELSENYNMKAFLTQKQYEELKYYKKNNYYKAQLKKCLLSRR